MARDKVSGFLFSAVICMKKAKRSLLGPSRTPVRIACIDRSNGKLDVPIERLTRALQAFYDRHFLPVWGCPVDLYVTRKAKRADWQLVYYEHPEQDEVLELGRHQLVRNRQPISKIFVTVLGDEPVSRAASHELFEMVRPEHPCSAGRSIQGRVRYRGYQSDS